MEQTQEQTVRRVCSMPIRQSPAARSYSNTPIQSPNPENIDLLFTHPSCKIVSFNTASYSSFPSPTSASYSSSFSSCTLNEDRDLLPFTSSCERTLASGLLRLYRSKPHNIAFIHSGSILHPVLAKSQCWCVDEARGIFCLRIRPGSYWRIEISE